MPRVAAVLLGAACLVGVAIPAGAAPPETSNSAVLNVYWTTREPTGPQTYRQTTWYVGAYVSSDYGSSDAYQDVYNCRVIDPPNVQCRQESYKVGYSYLDRPGEYFTIDPENLDYASLRGLYPLQTYDQHGNPVGPVEWTVITADVTGQGDVTSYRDTYDTHNENCHYRTTTNTIERGFTATGTENGVDLGTTSTGYMSSSESRTVSHCNY